MTMNMPKFTLMELMWANAILKWTARTIIRHLGMPNKLPSHVFKAVLRWS
jgi:hypothetical protein